MESPKQLLSDELDRPKRPKSRKLFGRLALLSTILLPPAGLVADATFNQAPPRQNTYLTEHLNPQIDDYYEASPVYDGRVVNIFINSFGRDNSAALARNALPVSSRFGHTLSLHFDQSGFTIEDTANTVIKHIESYPSHDGTYFVNIFGSSAGGVLASHLGPEIEKQQSNIKIISLVYDASPSSVETVKGTLSQNIIRHGDNISFGRFILGAREHFVAYRNGQNLNDAEVKAGIDRSVDELSSNTGANKSMARYIGEFPGTISSTPNLAYANIYYLHTQDPNSDNYVKVEKASQDYMSRDPRTEIKHIEAGHAMLHKEEAPYRRLLEEIYQKAQKEPLKTRQVPKESPLINDAIHSRNLDIDKIDLTNQIKTIA